MPRYAIAFLPPKGQLLHHLVEMDSRDAALRFFFKQHLQGHYSQDSEGYGYFQDDFQAGDEPQGSLLEV